MSAAFIIKSGLIVLNVEVHRVVVKFVFKVLSNERRQLRFDITKSLNKVYKKLSWVR